jgi:hypothetical protein
MMDKTTLYARDLTDIAWRKSSFSEDTAVEVCVEFADLGDGAVALRDSNDRTREPLRFTGPEWAAFGKAVVAGEFGTFE